MSKTSSPESRLRKSLARAHTSYEEKVCDIANEAHDLHANQLITNAVLQEVLNTLERVHLFTKEQS